MTKVTSISLTDRQWNILEVALDRFIDEQVDDGSKEATEYAARARIVKFLMQAELEVQHGN
tara:strand:- start:253 stop:435 length:183 start_codon:yes stop_codon:yes gene_type:complete